MPPSPKSRDGVCTSIRLRCPRFPLRYLQAGKQIRIETDFATITVNPKGQEHREFLIEHALHILMREYRGEYGLDAAIAVLNSLRGYHGKR